MTHTWLLHCYSRLADMARVSQWCVLIAVHTDMWMTEHTGVASALRAAKSGEEPKWKPPYAFNTESLPPSTAGYLLGLSLSGQLKHMRSFHVYHYLTQVSVEVCSCATSDDVRRGTAS